MSTRVPRPPKGTHKVGPQTPYELHYERCACTWWLASEAMRSKTRVCRACDCVLVPAAYKDFVQAGLEPDWPEDEDNNSRFVNPEL